MDNQNQYVKSGAHLESVSQRMLNNKKNLSMMQNNEIEQRTPQGNYIALACGPLQK